MISRLFACIAVFMALWATPNIALAQQGSGAAIVVGTCGTANYATGTIRMPTQDIHGNLCSNGSGGGGGGGATSNPLQPLISVPTTSATATATQTYSNGVILQIPTTNTGTICWGPTNTVTATFAAGTKTCLSNTVGIVATSVGVNNLSLLGYVISSNGTDLVQYTAN